MQLEIRSKFEGPQYLRKSCVVQLMIVNSLQENAKFMQVAIEFQNCDAACFLDLWQLCKEIGKESAKRCFSRFPVSDRFI